SIRCLLARQQNAQRLIDAHDVADALERVGAQPRGPLPLPLEERRARWGAQERPLFFRREPPARRDVEERRQRGLAELIGIEGRVRVAALKHDCSPQMEFYFKYSILGPSASRTRGGPIPRRSASDRLGRIA